MMSALYAGVAGMQAHQVKLDVIGNNVANVNTVGYKSSNVTFAEAISQLLSDASSASDDGLGGTNPKQVGTGVGVANITRNDEVGSLQPTGTTTDLAIDGEGYFIVKSGDSDEYFFTRAGNFGVDSDGNLVTSDGYYVCGFVEGSEVDGKYVFDTTDDVKPINIFEIAGASATSISPESTTEIELDGNLDSTTGAKGDAPDDIGDVINEDDYEADYSTSIYAYDAVGGQHDYSISFTKCYVDDTTDETTYYYTLTADDGSILTDVDGNAITGYIKFDGEGNIVTDEEAYDASISINLDPGGGVETTTFELDFSELTMYGSDSDVTMSSYDGYASGDFSSFSIGSDGVVTVTYTNGKSQDVAQIALAQFSNAAGLKSLGSNLYAETVNSGTFSKAYIPGSNGTGPLASGYLEMSNVDLSTELTNMITTQRGYQACSRVITTADEMLQALMNI